MAIVETLFPVLSQQAAGSTIVDSAQYRTFCRSLLDRVRYKFQLSGAPDSWNQDYFWRTLLLDGYICIADFPPFGVLPQRCTLGGEVTLWEEGSTAYIANPIFSAERTIGVDCAIIKCSPDFTGVRDIIEMYATKLALVSKAQDASINNCMVGSLVVAKNKAAAQTFKLAQQRILNGELYGIAETPLGENASLSDAVPWYEYKRDVKADFIGIDCADLMRTIYNAFDTEIGINNANTSKRERLNADEVNANNAEISSRTTVWLDCMRQGVDQANKLFGLPLSITLRAAEEKEIDTNA